MSALSHYEQQIKQSADRFTRDTANHVMTVLHDDGVYRHLRCQQPGRSCWWFEIVTWPGSLAIRGDFDSGLVFSRITDMFAFFRGGRHGINPDYWAEKLGGGRRSVREYDEELLKEYVHDLLDDAAGCAKDEDDEDLRAAVGKGHALLHRYIEDGDTTHEKGARDLLSELEAEGLTSDTWEVDLHSFTSAYLWACHAIVWAIGRYDAAQGGAR